MRLLVIALLPVLLIAGEASTDPSLDEVAVLLQANRHRSDRVTVDNRITELIKAKQVVAKSHSWSMVSSKGAVVPPLVLNPALATAARRLLQDGAKPPDSAPFDATPAAQAAGYPAPAGLIAMFGLDAPDLESAYASAMLNVVASKQANNMTVDTFAAQGALTAAYREIGVAVSRTASRVSVVILLGKSTAKRLVGGFAYADADRDLAFAPGEGKAGVTVSCGGASITTGPSGAWWLALPDDAAVAIAFNGGGFNASRPIAKGTANLIADWRLPAPADLKAADRLIADAEKVAANPDLEKKRMQLAALLSGTRMASLDDARQKQVDSLIEPLLAEYDAAVAKLLALLGEEPAEAKTKLADLRKNWKGAMPAWFKEADTLLKLRQQVNSALAAPKEQQGKLAGPALKLVQKAASESLDPRFLRQYAVWCDQLAEAMPAPPKGK